jgi:hypothetical protein
MSRTSLIPTASLVAVITLCSLTATAAPPPATAAPDLGAVLLGALPPESDLMFVVRGYRAPPTLTDDVAVFDATRLKRLPTPAESFDDYHDAMAQAIANTDGSILHWLQPPQERRESPPSASFRATAYYRWGDNGRGANQLLDWITLMALDRPLNVGSAGASGVHTLPAELTDEIGDRPIYGFYTAEYVVYSNSRALRDHARDVLAGKKPGSDSAPTKLRITSKSGVDGVFAWANLARKKRAAVELPARLELSYTRNQPDKLVFRTRDPECVRMLQDRMDLLSVPARDLVRHGDGSAELTLRFKTSESENERSQDSGALAHGTLHLMRLWDLTPYE